MAQDTYIAVALAARRHERKRVVEMLFKDGSDLAFQLGRIIEQELHLPENERTG